MVALAGQTVYSYTKTIIVSLTKIQTPGSMVKASIQLILIEPYANPTNPSTRGLK